VAGIAAGLVVSVLAVLGLVRRDSARSAPQPLTAFGVLVPEGRYLPRSQSPLLDIAPDGRTLVFAAEGGGPARIFLRSFDRLEVREVPGTEGAEQPSLSPDGRWIAFFAGGSLRKIPVDGGAAVRVAEARAPRGVSWTPDGSLVFSPVFNSALWRVPATGGEPRQVTRIDTTREERSHRWPAVLPDGNTVLFTVGVASRPGDYDDGRIDAVRLDTGERRTVLQGARMARYSATGHIVFQRRQALLAVRFDAARLETLGEPFSIREGAGGETSSGAGYFAVSATGVLAYAPESAIPGERALVLVDRQGRETELAVPPAAYNTPRFSPDGRRLAMGVGSANAADDDVFLLDLSSQRLQRLTFGQGHGMPLWSPDGRAVVYTKGRSGDTGLAQKAADGSGEEVLVRSNAGNAFIANSWLPDGRRLAVTDTAGTFDVRLLDLEAESVEPLLANASTAEYAPAFSPDGRFLAYTSTETGVDEVFVETFPAGGGKWQVSNGGACPVWSRDGREIYYTADEAIVAVEVETNGVLRPGAPRRLFSGPYELRTMPLRNYDVAPDGRFALVKRRFVSNVPRELVVLDGWTSLQPSSRMR
jgi:serine/threonine-protein kinase